MKKRSTMPMAAGITTILLIVLFFQNSSTELHSTFFSETIPLDDHLEMARHEELYTLKNSSENVLSEFTTDGCSGGLSLGWEYLADRVQNFQKTYGTVPAWQSCCETHDFAYHTGGARTDTAAMSFKARQRADLALKTCVIEVGIQRKHELMKQYNLSAPELEQLYNGIANLMYGAVRIGGIPCTNLPWRWGYGWPECE